MKKSYLVIVVSVIVLISTVLWFFNAGMFSNLAEVGSGVIILVLLIFGFYFGWERFKSERRGQPSEDEFSRRLMRRAASTSYFISIYIWLALMYVDSEYKVETDILFGGGILAMAVVLAVCWIVYRWRGLRDE